MKLAILAFDTRGGVQPYIAQSLGLLRAGHDVTMITTGDFSDFIASHGVPVAATSQDTEGTVRQIGGAAELSARARNRLMREHFVATLGQTTAEVLAAASDADAIVAGIGGSLLGRPVAEALGVPFFEAHLQPLGPATGAFPGALLPHVPAWLGAPGRRLSHRATALALGTMLGGAGRRVRAELGLPSRPAARPTSPGAAYGFSPQVVPQPPEWGPEHLITGYWTLPPAPDWTPPPALADFLAAGPPPVCIGFGSISSRDPERMSELVLDAVRRAGVRAVLLSGWGGLAGRGGDDVFVTAEAPHAWLYPQMAAVVHHGGAGTTGAGFTAGVPAVVVPIAADQPFWASRVVALGTGPTPIPRKRLTASNLADALRAATSDAGMRERAAHLGAVIRREDGVTNAVRHLDRLLDRR